MGRRVRIFCIISGLLFAAGLAASISGCTDMALLEVIRERVEGVDPADPIDTATEEDESPTFTVTYDVNSASGGSVPEDSAAYEEGQTVTVLDNSGNLKKTDFLFSGWNTAADGSGITYTAGDSFTIGIADVVLYAKWIAQAQWARTVSAGSDESRFSSVAVDGSGNVYAAGYQDGNGTYTYGTHETKGGSEGKNSILVKYNTSGTALWTRTLSEGVYDSNFYSVAADSSGNVYGAGYQVGTGTYSYGTQDATGTSTGQNVVLVKYDSSGTALWARTVSAGSSDSIFNSLAVDGSGNVYAAGYQCTSGTYTYGTQNAAGTSDDKNVVLVKYNSSGTALWARTVSAGSSDSVFNSVAVDDSGNVYAAGYQFGNDTYTYGTKDVTGWWTYDYVVLVKYNSSGTAQWARTVSASEDSSRFYSVAVDGFGNIYAAGYQEGTDTYTYETQDATGTAAVNVVLVKYDSSGTAEWARTVSVGSDNSKFNSVVVDGLGNVYAAGYQGGTGIYTYGTRDVAGTYMSENVVLVKYDSSGTALWGRSVSAGSSDSRYNSVAVDGSGKVYTAGCQCGTGTYTYGARDATGTASRNVVLVKWEP